MKLKYHSVVNIRTGLPVPHRAPPHHLELGSAPRTFTRITVPHRATDIFLMINFKTILQVLCTILLYLF